MKSRAPRNKTLTCSADEIDVLSEDLAYINSPATVRDIEDRIIHQDIFEAARHLPKNFVDLLILDPPYNLSKEYDGKSFNRKNDSDYQEWFASLADTVYPLLKSNATVYVCSDWKTSILIAPILQDKFYVRNRITWEREKGRAASRNWKNNSEDIWFCTVSEGYSFDLDAVKQKRRVNRPLSL